MRRQGRRGRRERPRTISKLSGPPPQLQTGAGARKTPWLGGALLRAAVDQSQESHPRNLHGHTGVRRFYRVVEHGLMEQVCIRLFTNASL
jgi:hypothetical protein